MDLKYIMLKIETKEFDEAIKSFDDIRIGIVDIANCTRIYYYF
jgi:hypothetical protein